MKLSQFKFKLPEEQIALYPPHRVFTAEDGTVERSYNRDQCKLMVVHRKSGKIEMFQKDADGNDVAFLYNYDGSGSQGDDLYFNVSANGTTYTFTVESYLCGQDSDVYKAVEGLNVGDTVDMEGFLYWYEGVNPHITSVTVQ